MKEHLMITPLLLIITSLCLGFSTLVRADQGMLNLQLDGQINMVAVNNPAPVIPLDTPNPESESTSTHKQRDKFAPYEFTPASEPGTGLKGYWNKSTHFLEQIWHQGRQEIFLSGYAYHDPHTYSQEKLDTLNSNAWGGGYGRTVISTRGNEHTVYAMAFLDSHNNVQPMVGYAYQAIWGERIRFGAGGSLLITQRPDIFNGIPFPAAFPLFSIGTKKVSLNLVPIPKLSSSKNANNGNVLFAFLRVHWEHDPE